MLILKKQTLQNTLIEKYYASLKNLNNCDGILALSDLAGGSPFKTLVEVKMELEKPMEVVGGTNLPMALEISMTKDIIDDCLLYLKQQLRLVKVVS